LEIAIAGAIAVNASDIHFEPEEKFVRLRFRLDGVLHQLMEISPEIHKFINATRPITSTRRAISNLAKDGKLKKTAIQRPGEYGKLTYAYQLNF
jgi:type II secretory ATPase GspE/PulE/Tfp pilus assembly ATPase PilB-like protein